MDLKGGHFAETTAVPSSFAKKVSKLNSKIQKIHYPKDPDPIEQKEIKGRPLFVRELSKNNPAPDCYQVKRNTDILPVNLKRPCFFGHSYESYRRTCDIERGVKVYDYAAEKTNAAQYYPEMG